MAALNRRENGHLIPYSANILDSSCKFKNVAYDYIAKNRYQWFGKREECKIPTPEERNKFIE